MELNLSKHLTYLLLTGLLLPLLLPNGSEAAEKPQAEQNVPAIKGGGSQPISPLYLVWSKGYEARYKDATFSYKISNVVKGIEDLEANKIDFAGSEIPLKMDELKKKGLFQFPTALISFTPVANIPGVHNGMLKLDGDTLAGIFMGTIKKWNDPRLEELNPRLKLPDADIITVHRNTGNTITYVLSSYLSKVSPEWATKVGVGSTLNWPVGQEIGKGSNEEMMSYIKDTPYTIGFTMLTLVLKNNLNMIKMKNKAGNFVSVTPDAVTSASTNAKWNPDEGFYNVLTDQSGADTWPFVMPGYATFKINSGNPHITNTMINFFDIGLRRWQLETASVDLVPLPDQVSSVIRAELVRQRIGGAAK
jgi:phosphate transport system substrate-binding protein